MSITGRIFMNWSGIEQSDMHLWLFEALRYEWRFLGRLRDARWHAVAEIHALYTRGEPLRLRVSKLRHLLLRSEYPAGWPLPAKLSIGSHRKRTRFNQPFANRFPPLSTPNSVRVRFHWIFLYLPYLLYVYILIYTVYLTIFAAISLAASCILVSSLTVDIESIFSTLGNDKVVALDVRPTMNETTKPPLCLSSFLLPLFLESFFYEPLFICLMASIRHSSFSSLLPLLSGTLSNKRDDKRRHHLRDSSCYVPAWFQSLSRLAPSSVNSWRNRLSFNRLHPDGTLFP